MEAEEQVERLHEFLRAKCYEELMGQLRKGLNYLVVDFQKLLEFDSEVAEGMLEAPEDFLRAGEVAVAKFEGAGRLTKFYLRFKNLPESQKMAIREIRSADLSKFITVEGLVRQKSDVRPRVTSAKFECPACGAMITILQLESTFKEPNSCSCGRKGKFKMVERELVDAQGLVIEEIPETLEGGEQPKRLRVFLKEDLVSPMSERHTNPGSKIRVTGWVKEVPKLMRTGAKSTKFDLIFEGNYVESIEESFFDIQISPEEEKQINQIARSPNLFQMFVNSIAPSIYGHETVKLALVLQLVGGQRKAMGDGMVTRGDLHILLVGDPGAGKSQLLKRVAAIAPKGRYVSGKGVSGAGLTATVVKDEFMGGWSLEAGALVLANNGLCCIDELDKMSTEDRSAMHEALEQQTISISKANVQATLVAKTTVLAAANPKFGRFDPSDMIAKQIDLPPALINRFDLIFPIKDLPDEELDSKMASHILGLHQKSSEQEPEISNKLLRKYIAYARQRVNPRLSNEALNEIKEYYVKMRMSGMRHGEVRSIPISPRQLEALVRLSEASAKLRLSNEITKEDSQRAIGLLQYCLTKVGVDPETGQIDIDRISTGISASFRSRLSIVKGIISELDERVGKEIPIEQVTAACAEKGIRLDDAESVIQELKRSGDIYEPRPGFLSKL